jgi:hypothetical protein
MEACRRNGLLYGWAGFQKELRFRVLHSALPATEELLSQQVAEADAALRGRHPEKERLLLSTWGYALRSPCLVAYFFHDSRRWSMLRMNGSVKLLGWMLLAGLAYINWKSSATIYGLEYFHVTSWLWRSTYSLFLFKTLAVFVAFLEGSVLVFFSPSIFLLTWLEPSAALRDVIVGANIAIICGAANWQNPPKQDLAAQLNSSTSEEFKSLGKLLSSEGVGTHLHGSLAWLCDELAGVVALRKKLSSTSLCRHLLLVHLHVVLAGANTEVPPPESFEELVSTARSYGLQLQPDLRQLWDMAGALLNDLLVPESRSLDATYSTLLIGTLGVAKNTATLLQVKGIS